MRRSLIVLAVLCAAALPAAAAPPSSPDPHTQSLADGCQRYGIGIVALTAPEWVYVGRDQVAMQKAMGDPLAGSRTVGGTVVDVHPAGDDEFYNHDYNDVDVDVQPDTSSAGLVEKGGLSMGLEWEEAQVPGWAWPQKGDTVRASGSHIWDCGHWGNGPADPTPGGFENIFVPYDPIETGQDVISYTATGQPVIRGEQTELHPLYELATTRDAAGPLDADGDHTPDTPSVLKQLDVWVNSDGGWAHAEEECTFLGLPPSSNHACSRYRDVSGTYSYTVDLGAKPLPSSQMVWNAPEIHVDESSAALQQIPVTVQPGLGNAITVSFTLPHIADPERFGVTVRAGWSGQTAVVRKHHVVVDSLRIFHSLDSPQSEPSLNPINNGPEQVKDPAEWVAWVNVSGAWAQVPPALLQNIHEPAASEVETKPLNMAFDVWLPDGVAPRVFFSTRECDIPLIDCASDFFGAMPSATPFTELGYNDHPGRIEQPNSHLGIALAGGTQTFQPGSNPQHTANEDLSDYSCNGPCYALTVTSD